MAENRLPKGRALFSRLLGRKHPAGLVLLYHRVAPIDADPQLLAVRPETFDAHLEMLCRHASPMPLADLVDRMQSTKPPRRGLAITFDDGYVDNLRFAKPLLLKHRVPATIFAVSGAIRSQSEYWWDAVERALLRTHGPATLRLGVDDLIRQWNVDGNPSEFTKWNVLSPHDPTPRHTAYREIMPIIKALSPGKRERSLSDLLNQLGLDARPRSDQRPMTVAELRNAANSGLIDIGAHTVTHPQLSALPPEDQLAQIRGSKKDLEDMLGLPVSSFAYPYGSEVDYSAETVRLVAQAGFSIACVNVPGIVRPDTDRFEVPRLLVRDVPVQALERQIFQYFNA